MTMSHQIGNINKEIEILKWTKQKSGNEKYNNLNVKFHGSFNGRFKSTEERISDL